MLFNGIGMSQSIDFFVAQWIAHWPSKPKVAGSSPVKEKQFFFFCHQQTMNLQEEKVEKDDRMKAIKRFQAANDFHQEQATLHTRFIQTRIEVTHNEDTLLHVFDPTLNTEQSIFVISFRDAVLDYTKHWLPLLSGTQRNTVVLLGKASVVHDQSLPDQPLPDLSLSSFVIHSLEINGKEVPDSPFSAALIAELEPYVSGDFKGHAFQIHVNHPTRFMNRSLHSYSHRVLLCKWFHPMARSKKMIESSIPDLNIDRLSVYAGVDDLPYVDEALAQFVLSRVRARIGGIRPWDAIQQTLDFYQQPMNWWDEDLSDPQPNPESLQHFALYFQRFYWAYYKPTMKLMVKKIAKPTLNQDVVTKAMKFL